jgi:hypothetical protein
MVLQIPSNPKAATVTWEALPADFVLLDNFGLVATEGPALGKNT